MGQKLREEIPSPAPYAVRSGQDPNPGLAHSQARVFLTTAREQQCRYLLACFQERSSLGFMFSKENAGGHGSCMVSGERKGKDRVTNGTSPRWCVELVDTDTDLVQQRPPFLELPERAQQPRGV